MNHSSRFEKPGRMRMISSRATSMMSFAVMVVVAARFCSASMMRNVIGTPISERMRFSSSSSQSTGRPVNFLMMFWKNFIR